MYKAGAYNSYATVPVLNQACTYFKDTSLPAYNNVISWAGRQRGNWRNTSFSDSRPIIRPPVFVQAAPRHREIGDYNNVAENKCN